MLWTLAAVLGAALGAAWGHGMLMDPVNRGSAWRLGFHTPFNYDDDGQFCGGISVQWNQNGGRCGECGDDWALPRPRPQENGGEFGLGVIVKSYEKGTALKTSSLLTANHKGFFRFALCPLGAADQLETEECFAQWPLRTLDGQSTYYVPNHGTGFFNVTLLLPPDLTCSHCVVQWTYTAGNNWGICPNGTGMIGCGPQETFRTCSDISIL